LLDKAGIATDAGVVDAAQPAAFLVAGDVQA